MVGTFEETLSLDFHVICIKCSKSREYEPWRYSLVTHACLSMATFSASHVAHTHTVFASTAFATALILACTLHYKKIVKNDVAKWPEEWWPSVSATWARLFDLGSGEAGLTFVDRIGDWYPERNIFQILIALTSGLPRFPLRPISFTHWIHL